VLDHLAGRAVVGARGVGEGIDGLVGGRRVTAHGPIEPHRGSRAGPAAADVNHPSAGAGAFPRRSGGWAPWENGAAPNTVGVMSVTPSPPAPRRRSRVNPAALASVIVGGLLFCSWFWISLAVLLTGLSALPALGSGLLLLIPWILAMQLAV